MALSPPQTSIRVDLHSGLNPLNPMSVINDFNTKRDREITDFFRHSKFVPEPRELPRIHLYRSIKALNPNPCFLVKIGDNLRTFVLCFNNGFEIHDIKTLAHRFVPVPEIDPITDVLISPDRENIFVVLDSGLNLSYSLTDNKLIPFFNENSERKDVKIKNVRISYNYEHIFGLMGNGNLKICKLPKDQVINSVNEIGFVHDKKIIVPPPG